MYVVQSNALGEAIEQYINNIARFRTHTCSLATVSGAVKWSLLEAHIPGNMRLVPRSGVSRGLARALAAAVTCALSSPFLVRWASDEWHFYVIGFAIALVLPGIVCACITIRQERRGLATSFDPEPLTGSLALATIAAFAICIFGVVGAAIDLLLVPMAGMFLAVAWVQPRRRQVVATAVLGGLLVVLVAWFVGRADEYWNEAVVSALLIVCGFVLLARLRARGMVSARTHA
jgi:hypothetical protein